MENKKLLPVVNKRLVNEPVNLHECCQSKLQFREVIRCATASQVDIMVKAMFSNTIGQREYLLEMLNCSYVIPVYLHDCVSTGIRYLATKNYSDEAIDRMVKKPLCLADCLSSLGSINDGDSSTVKLLLGKCTPLVNCQTIAFGVFGSRQTGTASRRKQPI